MFFLFFGPDCSGAGAKNLKMLEPEPEPKYYMSGAGAGAGAWNLSTGSTALVLRAATAYRYCTIKSHNG